LKATSTNELQAELIRLGVRRLVDEALEVEASEAARSPITKWG
jgi:hypothetical protein